MANQKRAQFSRLETGYQFPSTSYTLTPDLIESYITATGDIYPAYDQKKLVPPTAVAAYALAALANEMEVPPGTIHTSQEIESIDLVYVNDTITSLASVSSIKSRKNMVIMAIDINVTNQNGVTVIQGKTTFLSSSQTII